MLTSAINPKFVWILAMRWTNENSTALLLGAIAGFATCGVLMTWKKGRSLEGEERQAPRRFGGAIKLKREMFDRYTELHDAVWDSVLERMYESNIRNFTIYYHEETSTMFSHFEWIGHWHRNCSPSEEKAMFEADMKAIADDPITREWWKQCEPCQEPFSQWPAEARPPSEGGQGDWWAPLQCLNHCGHWAMNYSNQRRDPDFVPQNPQSSTTTQPKLSIGESSDREQ